jgi:hypothetical protein
MRNVILQTRQYRRTILSLVFFFLFVVNSFAQQDTTVKFGPAGIIKGGTPAKSAKVRRPGFDLPDSLYVAVDSNRGDIDTIVYYTAKDSTVFDIDNKLMILTGEAKLDFRTQHLTAHKIILDFNASTLTAMSEAYDSVIETSLARRRRIIRDTARVVSRGAPKLVDGTTPYEGEIIIYNLKTRRGTVKLATTSMQEGYYYGERIKQVAEKTLFVENGRYTTCDAPVPHYYFEAPRMKILTGEQILAQPIHLFIADVPIFTLPFAVFPDKGGGRRSGLIPPNYTVSNAGRGYGLTHLGYYQIFSDYFDAAARSDIYTKGGYNLSLDLQYMQRYLLNSPISVSLGYGKTRYDSENPFETNFRTAVRVPNLIIDPVTSLTADLEFLSNNYNRNNAQSISDVVNQQASSRASFSTSFEDIGAFLSASYQRSQNLRTGTYQETSPSLSFGKSSPIHPFGDPTSGETPSVLESFAISYSGNATRSVSKSLTERPSDTLRGIRGDTSFAHREQYRISHSPSVSISPKLGHISLTPSFAYGEQWFIRRTFKTARVVYDTFFGKIDTSIAFDERVENGLFRESNYNYGVSMATTLYGIANVGAFGLKAIRHAVQPSISFRYTPDFSSAGIDRYYDPLLDTVVAYSLYENDGGYGGGSRSGAIGFSLGNDFEAKIEHEVTPDSSYNEKIKLLNLGVNSGYDIIQERFSPLGISASSHIGTFLSVSGNASYSWYPAKRSGGDSVEQTLISLKQGILRPTNVSFSFAGSLSSTETSDGVNMDSLRRLIQIETPDEERKMFLGGMYPGAFISIPFRPKWNINYSVSYSESYTISGTDRNLLGNLSIGISPSRLWNITTSLSYDFTRGKIVVPDIRIYRDLHCWEMSLSYRPSGTVRGFNFEIRIKADQLRDIKLTRQESTYGTF